MERNESNREGCYVNCRGYILGTAKHQPAQSPIEDDETVGYGVDINVHKQHDNAVKRLTHLVKPPLKIFPQRQQPDPDMVFEVSLCHLVVTLLLPTM